MRALFAMTLLLGGCDPQPPTDDQRYAEALRGPLDGAPAACDAIAEPRLRGDCQSAAAARFAAAGRYPEAKVQCDRIIDPLWHDECWFGIGDAAELLGPDAIEACEKSNRYHSFCRRHILQRVAAQLDVPVGEEPAAVRRFGKDVAQILPLATPEIVEHTANTLVAEALSRRWEAEVFDPALCGTMTVPLCQHAYWYAATRLLGEMRTVCAAPLTSAATQAAGMSGYTSAGAPIAEAVWADLCQQLASGKMVPDEIGSAQPADLTGGLLPVE